MIYLLLVIYQLKHFICDYGLGFEPKECECGECTDCIEQREAAKDREHDEMCALGYK